MRIRIRIIDHPHPGVCNLRFACIRINRVSINLHLVDFLDVSTKTKSPNLRRFAIAINQVSIFPPLPVFLRQFPRSLPLLSSSVRDTPRERVSYAPFPNLEKDNNEMQYADDDDNHQYNDSMWSVPDSHGYPSRSPALQPGYSYHYPAESEDYIDEGYSSSADTCNYPQVNNRPEVNLKTVLTGLLAIVTGRNKGLLENQNVSGTNVSFLGSGNNGDTVLHPSVYIPSAPPLLETNGLNYSAFKEVLEAEPPEWLPDSRASGCMQCIAPFTALTRGRHHCRFCGGIFCRACSKGRCLLPAKFRERNPQRVCDTCYDRLDPLQGILINNLSNAMQVAKHDVMDWTCTRRWLNLPVGMSMEQEIYKATVTLRSYTEAARLNPERSVPHAILQGARGLAILTVAKVGVLVTYKVGTGLVVSRKPDGTWSAPSSIASVGLGWGAQVGGELTDFIIVLHDLKAVKAFCSRMHFSLGAGCSAAAGPVGRSLEADVRAGDKGSGICYTYSCSKGAFVGVSLEGNIVSTRMDVNLRFYGDPYLTTTDILLGMVDRPKAAEPLYAALQDLYSKMHS